MILIIGGVYQGKLGYAKTRFTLSEEDVYRCDAESIHLPEAKSIIYELDKWFLALIRAKLDPMEELNSLIESNAEAIVIANDISCGIVPVEAEMRIWRETVGRGLIKLSAHADEVWRLFCGMPMRLK